MRNLLIPSELKIARNIYKYGCAFFTLLGIKILSIFPYRNCSMWVKSCNLHLVKLEGCRFQNVIFEKCKIVAAEFNLCDKKFFSIQFDQCVLMGCNFSGLNMKKTHFGKSKSTENFFNGTQLQEANFCGCDFLGSVFHHANLSKADFTNAVNYSIDPRSNVLKDATFSLPEAVSLLNFLEIKIS